jgi:hypothetical protein
VFLLGVAGVVGVVGVPLGCGVAWGSAAVSVWSVCWMVTVYDVLGAVMSAEGRCTFSLCRIMGGGIRHWRDWITVYGSVGVLM